MLSRLNLRIDNDDRIALLGANGNGKVHLRQIAVGSADKPTTAPWSAPHNLKTGYFAQHQLEDLVPGAKRGRTRAQASCRMLLMPVVRSRVAQMGLSTEKMDTPARDLSGGEKARLLMGLAAFEGPNLIILDEPTNHLDIDSRAALIDALNGFEGAVILISHDQHLIEATAERLWLVDDGSVEFNYDGDLGDYRTLIIGGSKGAEPAQGGSIAGNSKAEPATRRSGTSARSWRHCAKGSTRSSPLR